MSRGDSRARQPGCFRQLCCMSRATAREMEAPTPKLSLPSSRSGAEGSSGRPPRQPSSRQAQYSRPVGPAGPWAPCMAAAACGIMPLQTMSMYSGAVHETGGLKLWSPKSAPEPMCPGAYGPPGFVFDQSMAPMGAMGAVSSARRAEKRGREYSPHAGPMPSMGRLASPVSPECAPARPESSLSARSGIEGVVSARARGEKAGGSKAGKALPQLAIAAPGVASLSPRFSEVAGEGFQYTPSAFTPTSAYSYGINSSEQFSAVGGFDPASIQWGGFLGRGNFSTVYKGRIDGIDYGVKIIRNPVSKGTERLAGFMANNVLHPNLVRVCGVKSVTVHCSLEAAAGPGMERSLSMASTMDAAQSPSSCPPGDKEPSIMDDDKSEFSALARNIPHKGGPGREDTETWVLMEFCDAGTLEKAIERGLLCEGGRYDKPKMLHILFAALEIASAMTHLHSCGIIHGDLKPENVLLQSCEPSPMGMEFTCKVGDFGLSRRTSIHSTANNDSFKCGTVPYMAPEVLRDNTSTYAADVYSFGVLLWEMLSGQKAYGNSTQAATLVAIVDGRRPKMPAFFPSWYSQLVEDCWHQNRQARPNFADIVERINLMVLAFERPRTPDHFMPESYSSNHSEMIVAYPGAQPFMEGDLHTNPFYEHDQSEGIFEPTAYCVPESNFHSISFDDMACGPGSALPLAPPVMMAASPPSRRKQPRAKRSTLSDNSLPDLRESEPDADSQDGTAATKSQQDTPSEAPETIEPTPGASESEEEADVVTRFRKFSASLGRSSPIPEERVSLLGGTSKKGSTFMRASGESMRVLGRPSMVSTEASITPRSSCATPTDSEYWGSDWSPPRTAGQRGESSKSNKAGKPSASAKAAGDKGGASSSGRRGVMDSMSRDVHYVNQWDPMMSSGLLREAELGATFLRPVKVQGGEPSQPLWDSFMTPAAREFGSPCVMYGGGAV
ncbi:unnamed protein product [Ostreobium quekettii]|uniref:Protein kinase domain-containing protein n=1 Tax=Ostreobium quekettii TaxID=121088 RepID=A0A8S1JCP3_9CHLO|nr:unnamed protein product [Ostreobium quekettii]